jgi:hypothetical protein
MTPQRRQEPRGCGAPDATTSSWCYDADDGVEAVDWLGADGVEAVLASFVLELVFAAGLRP